MLKFYFASIIWGGGDFLDFFYVFTVSTLLHLPPLAVESTVSEDAGIESRTIVGIGRQKLFPLG
jgi:hypothetical protein